MARTSWTDERLDAVMDKIYGRFDSIEAELRAQREEFRGEFRAQRAENREEHLAIRTEQREELRALRADFSALQSQMIRIGWTVAAALTTALVGMFATLLVAVV